MPNHFKYDKKYLYWGLTAFCVIVASIIFSFLLQKLPEIGALINEIAGILQPFGFGLLIAYLLSPLMKKLNAKLPKWASVLICELVLLLVLSALVYLIIPQLYQSIESILKNGPRYVSELEKFIEKILDEPGLQQKIEEYLSETYKSLTDLFATKLLPSFNSIVSNLTVGVSAVVSWLFNLLIGIIVSAYVLANKDGLIAGFRRILYSVLTIPAAEKVRAGLQFANKTFLNFFSGKVLDSAIIGVICYIFCLIAKMPYSLLVSVIVGVTNIIPFFGPFIGGIPTALIILLTDPVKALIYIVFIIVLQQIDGNFIGPKILGSTTGISGFWVMFAIILGGGLFGFWGMLFGVPVFVCIYAFLKSCIHKKLRRSGLPQDRESYIHLDHVDQDTLEMVKKKEKTKTVNTETEEKASQEKK